MTERQQHEQQQIQFAFGTGFMCGLYAARLLPLPLVHQEQEDRFPTPEVALPPSPPQVPQEATLSTSPWICSPVCTLPVPELPQPPSVKVEPVCSPLPAGPGVQPNPCVHDDGGFAGSFILPFGVHKGESLGSLPIDYLQWLAKPDLADDSDGKKWIGRQHPEVRGMADLVLQQRRLCRGCGGPLIDGVDGVSKRYATNRLHKSCWLLARGKKLKRC